LIVESNGVGYRIFTSLSTISGIGEIGQEVKVYTYLYVREDVISLYGFLTQEELNVFELLISVSGVDRRRRYRFVGNIALQVQPCGYNR